MAHHHLPVRQGGRAVEQIPRRKFNPSTPPAGSRARPAASPGSRAAGGLLAFAGGVPRAAGAGVQPQLAPLHPGF